MLSPSLFSHPTRSLEEARRTILVANERELPFSSTVFCRNMPQTSALRASAFILKTLGLASVIFVLPFDHTKNPSSDSLGGLRSLAMSPGQRSSGWSITYTLDQVRFILKFCNGILEPS